MDDGSALGRLSFGGTRVRTRFVQWEIHIAPGSQRLFDAPEWRDTIVVVESGDIELETISGARVAFATGAVLFLGTWLRALRNRGHVPVVLSAVARRER
jgi:hypothetical protein